VAGGFSACSDAVARDGDGDRVVGVTVEVPQRRFWGGCGIIERAASTAAYRRREKVRSIGDHVPHAGTAHGLPHHVNALAVDEEFAGQVVHDFQGKFVAVAEAGEVSRRIFREIVATPAAVGLRHKDVTGTPFLIFREKPAAGAKEIAKAQLLAVIVAQAAAAVQIND